MMKYKNDIVNFLFILLLGSILAYISKVVWFVFMGIVCALVTLYNVTVVFLVNNDENIRRKTNMNVVKPTVLLRQTAVIVLALVLNYFVVIHLNGGLSF